MRRIAASSLISLSIALSGASPAFAGGKNEQATAAIAAAEAKIDAANKVGASGEVPHLQARAGAALRAAKNDLNHGEKDQAILDANRAAELADQAIGESQKAQAGKAAIQQGAAAEAAEEAAAANARADAAQRAATARPTPVVIAPVAAAPTTSTTVTTDTNTSAAVTHRRATHRTVHHRPRRSGVGARVRTTTTVTSQ
jgi:nitric oxide reductase activation protein